MKKLLFTFFAGAFLVTGSVAQSNLNLETWTGNECNEWGTLNSFMFLGAPQTVYQETSDPGQCASSAKIQTGYWAGATGFGASSDTVSGFFTLGAAITGAIGLPFTMTPSSMTFMFKGEVVSGDTALILVSLSVYDTAQNTIAQGMLLVYDSGAVFLDAFGQQLSQITTNNGAWNSVTIPIWDFSFGALTPDSLQIICASSSGSLFGSPLPLIGSTIYVDGFGFGGSGICNTTTACFGTTANGMSPTFNAGATHNPDATYTWDYGNSTTGTGMSTSNTYTTPGTYSVCLIVTDSCGTDTTCSNVDICSTPGVASFTSASDSLIASFAATGSTNSNPTYAWDFGDGSTGTGATATHTYADSGTFNVCLVLTDDCGADTTCTTITVTLPPVSISDDLKIEGLNIYPNPAKDFVIIKTKSVNIMDVQLYDLQGQLLLDDKNVPTAEYKIARGDLAKGAYFIRITSGGKQMIKQVVFE